MTPIAPLPTTWGLLQAALQARRPVEVSYHGRCRLICPHALGWHNGRAMVLGYQPRGHTPAGAPPPHHTSAGPASSAPRPPGRPPQAPYPPTLGNGGDACTSTRSIKSSALTRPAHGKAPTTTTTPNPSPPSTRSLSPSPRAVRTPATKTTCGTKE